MLFWCTEILTEISGMKAPSSAMLSAETGRSTSLTLEVKAGMSEEGGISRLGEGEDVETSKRKIKRKHKPATG